MEKSLTIGIIGLGYWGPNIARVLMESPFVASIFVYDSVIEKAKAIAEKHSQATYVLTAEELFSNPTIDAIVIASPVSTHVAYIQQGLQSNKHVFCEKPISTKIAAVLAIQQLARATQKMVMVGHVFEFNPIVTYMQRKIADHSLGKIYYLNFIRNGLGPIRDDVNVIADLASHDISIAHFLLQCEPLAVSANATSFFGNDKEDIATIHLAFPNKIVATIQVSWLDPIKQRQVKVVAEKKMLLFDDVSIKDKLKIIETGKSYQDYSGNFASFQHKIKDGDISIPHIDYSEPLAEEIHHFLSCILEHKPPLTDLANALRVTKVLEAAEQSLQVGGKQIYLT